MSGYLRKQIGISAVSYHFPPGSVSMESLKKKKLVSSSLEELKNFGFRDVHISGEVSAYDLARKATQKLLTRHRIDPHSIDLIIYASALPESSLINKSQKTDASVLFKYPATRLQYELDMRKSQVVGVSQAGCVSIWTAIRIAKNTLMSEKTVKRILCVSADVLPRGTSREILYNVISDAGCAVLVEKNTSKNVIVSQSQITKGYYWNPSDQMNEIITSYFPTAKRVIEDSLKEAHMAVKDLKYVIPHNVNRRSWEILASMVGIPLEKVYLKNIAKHGHTVAVDNIVNFSDLIQKNYVRKGDYLLLFTFGFGSHWSSTIVKH